MKNVNIEQVADTTIRMIYKYRLEPTERQILELDPHAQILRIDIQDDVPQLWALVNPNAKPEERYFYTVGTGHPVKNKTNMLYIGTYQMYNGALVLHVFETGRTL